ALLLIDQEDINKFSMRKLGSKMNVSPTAVYRYFPNQGALFDGIVELVWQKAADIAIDPSANWQKQLFKVMSQLRSVLLE
ncbi:TetR/AcrR family transcriptional regulator, partial [Desulfocurvus sp. DL9XJH121]